MGIQTDFVVVGNQIPNLVPLLVVEVLVVMAVEFYLGSMVVVLERGLLVAVVVEVLKVMAVTVVEVVWVVAVLRMRLPQLRRFVVRQQIPNLPPVWWL